MHDMRGNFAIAALCMAGGGTLVSVAGAINDPRGKSISLSAGITMFALGFLGSLFTLLWVTPRQPAVSSRRG